MIDERLIEIVTERLIQRIQDTNVYILQEIGNSIKQLRDITPSKRQQLIQILRYGESYQDILNKISKMTNLNVKDIEDIFMNISQKDYEFADKFYKARGIKPIPFKENVKLINQTKAIARVIQKDMYDFTRKNVLGYSIRDLKGNIQFVGLKETYNRVIEEAITNISQGKLTFDDSMTRIMKDIGGSGLKKIDYSSGRSIRLDSMVRTHVQEGLRTLHNANQELFGKEFNANMVEVSHHSNSAPDHIDTVDGKQFARIDVIREQIKNGIEKEIKLEDIQGNRVKVKGKWYDDFDTINNNLARPVSTLNCYHYIFSGILGVTEPEYTKKELQEDKEKNLDGCEIDGKHYTLYEASQLCRQFERKIREQKDIQILGKSSNNLELISNSQMKITYLTRKYKEVCDISGLPYKAKRLAVVGYKRANVKKLK